MRDWIAINGRRMIWEDFIDILERGKDRTVVRMKSRDVGNRYRYMACVLQELAFDYHLGSDSVPDHRESFIRRHCMEMPNERRLPEALEELFNQMQESLQIDFSEMLDECVANSAETHRQMQERKKRENARRKLIQALGVRGNMESGDVTEKVCYLIRLQQEKEKCPDYRVVRQEILVTGMWCELLISSLSADTVTNGFLRRTVENDILSETDITELLKEKCHIEKDYEWYSEELLGCTLDEPTDIRIEDLLPQCERKFREILGISSKI